MSVEQPAQPRAPSSSSPSISAALPPSPRIPVGNGLAPCAATAAYFLFAQGPVILSLHHDTLALDRRFEKHDQDILFISVDNVSERGAGRLVVSYDAGQTAIVWDLFTGQEISRFASFELIRVAAWMRNGNVAFGNVRGEVILFEPSTSEHISSRTIFDPISALAPAADCQAHAIGYLNGSILIAKLQPTFTILHTLSTSRGPSPILSLAWHASSAKQKSDMLATQSVEGDLFLWSVSRQLREAPRVIRSLKRSESSSAEPKWLAWSKNGRIIQYADGETWAWDVRTKHVTYDPIPTVQGVRGLASYGPTATLFTLGPDHSVQQYDIGGAVMTANVQHLPGSAVPSTTPVAPVPAPTSEPHSRKPSLTLQNLSDHDTKESKASSASPRSTPTEVARTRPEPVGSPVSLLSRTASLSSGASSTHRRRYYKSRPSKSIYSGTTTTFSTGSPVQSFSETSLYSGSSLRYGSSASAGGFRGHLGGSRLRNEVLTSPEEDDAIVTELFPFARNRINALPYTSPRRMDEENSTPDQLRRQMLSIVFGWEADIEDLIRDEISRNAVGSPRAVILSRWLGHIDSSLMVSMATSITSSYMDWMLLALSQLGDKAQIKQIGRPFVQRLLGSGDVHCSVAVLLGIGDGEDAIEVYVSRHMYMEAILLTCLLTPLEWPRLSYLVRKWGEHVVQNSQQHLALRCFSCADGGAPAEAWMSPTVHMTSILNDQLRSVSPLAAAVSASTAQNNSNNNDNTAVPSSSRTAARNQSLKLITSFSPQPPQPFKFPGLSSADRTPTNAPGVTPIDSALPDSALSPGGSYRLGGGRSMGQTLSARAITPSSYAKHRLPSIGETPTDVMSPTFPAPKPLPTPDNSSSEKGRKQGKIMEPEKVAGDAPRGSVEYLTPARYNPEGESLDTPAKETPITAFPTKPDTPAVAQPQAAESYDSAFAQDKERTPRDLGIQWSPIDQGQRLNGATFKNPYAPDPVRYGSPPLTGEQDYNRYGLTSPGKASLKSVSGTSVSGRSIDEYISSLDEAAYHSRKPRNHRRDNDSESGGKTQTTTIIQSRGRSKQRYIQPAKRSPSSPIPMSPEDLARYSSGTADNNEELQPRQYKSRSRSKPRSTTSTGRKSSKARGRGDSPGRGLAYIETRRSRSRHKNPGFGVRSPSSPVPMSPSAAGEYARPADDSDAVLRFVNVERKQRLRSTDRGAARPGGRSTSRRRDASPDRRKERERDGSRARHRQEKDADVSNDDRSHMSPGRTRHKHSHSIGGGEQLPSVSMSPSSGYPFGNKAFNQSTGNLSRKEQAAAELEARRLSLARRPSAPAIPLPGERTIEKYAYLRSRNQSEDISPRSGESFRDRAAGKKASPAHSVSSDSTHSARLPANIPVGLPSTPRAMRHPKFSIGYAVEQDIPAVPSIPDGAIENAENLAAGVRRTNSAPVPDDVGVGGIPAHPHFNRQLPSTKLTNVTLPQRGEKKVSEPVPSPPILPELQHLQRPPPPPPLSANEDGAGSERLSIASGSGVGTINIAIDNGVDGSPIDINSLPQRPATTNSVQTSQQQVNNKEKMSVAHDQHRRGRSINENLSSRIRTFTDRMRSTSRSRNPTRSPPTDNGDMQMPYESVKMVVK